MSRFAPLAAAVAVVALASAGCASAGHPATANAAAGSTAAATTDGATPSAGDSSSGGPATTQAAGTASSVPKTVGRPASTRSNAQPSPSTNPFPFNPPRTGRPAMTVTATTQQNGGTVHVALGGTLSLVGFPSNWQPQTTDPAVLADPPLPVDPAMCKTPPGVPCQLPPLNYKAMAKGTVKVTAHRTQCGEARPCVPPES